MTRRLRAGVLAVLVAASSLAVAAPAPAADPATSGSGWSDTRTLSRVFTNADGTDNVVDSRTVTVTADHTENLRGRERIRISWKGARPSGARAANPFGEGGLAQEYPVVVMQCRGTDDPSLPQAQQVSPETCWTATRMQRSQSVADRVAVWRHDRYATEAERALKSGMSPFPGPAVCPDTDFLATRITPFRARDGRIFPSCTAETMAPEAAVAGAYPAAEVAAFTDADGSGEVQFEVRSETENESLGCSHTVACSVVVIPIMGVSCLDADRECRRGGRFLPGSSNFAQGGVDAAVSPGLWWTASNWRNRFSVPVTFGLPPNTCDVLDPRAPTGFYGSELLSQAALQWAPAYCLDKERFKFQHNRMPDEAGFELMESGNGAAALVSGEREASGTTKVGYAPTAITGFAVGYAIDRPENAGELTNLRLTPRLLAKLLTQSYPASAFGLGHPGMGENPLGLNVDPEFTALNPGLDTISREAAATVLSLSESSDVIGTLTDYIEHDPEARAFLDGEPDPWGMVVNPSYEGIELPVREWPLLDDYVPVTEHECMQQNPGVYFNKVAAPITSLRKIAEAVLDAWPNVNTRCERATVDEPWKLGRVERQGMGTRFMLGIVSLGDAERFGLRTAALRTGKATYVAPTLPALTKAIELAEQPGAVRPFVIDQADVRRAGDAYPGTMVVYTAARLWGMDRTDAAKVAQFIRVSTTEGQRPGSGNGQLPDGYLPLTGSGSTRRLFLAAQKVADLVEAQKAPALPVDEDDPEDDGGPADGPVPAGPGDSPAPGGDAPAAGGSAGPGKVGGLPVAAAPTAATSDLSSPMGRALLPALLVLGLLCAVGSVASRLSLLRGRR